MEELTKQDRIKITQSKKYKVLLLKSYFDKGYSDLGLVKYVFGMIGLDMILNSGLFSAVLIILAYGVLCFVYGIIFYKKGWRVAENEVSNQFNLLAREIRKKLKT